METVVVLVLLYLLCRLLFGRGEKNRSRPEREKQTFFSYPKGGYGLDDDPVMDELFFIDIMEDDR